MRRTLFLLLAVLLSAAEAGVPRPVISVSLDSTGKPDLSAVSPSLQWTVSGALADRNVDLSYTVRILCCVC